MGTAFINFIDDEDTVEKNVELEQVTLEIGRIVFRSLIETMQNERFEDEIWKGFLDSAYAIKYLYVGDNSNEYFDYGPAFLRAIEYLQKNGPPNYYPNSDLDLFYDQLSLLKEKYKRVRRQG